MEAGILTLDDFDFDAKTVILRLDINSPVNSLTGELVNDTRIRKSLPTIRELSAAGAKTIMLAHQGDTEDYHNLISLEPHAQRLSALLQRPVDFIDDIAGPAAIQRIKELHKSELLLLNNVRHFAEEVSTFINFVQLTPQQLAHTRLVKNLAPLADYYVCEAFSAAHRSSPSLIGLAEVLPAVGGRLFIEELSALTRVRESPDHPCVFVLGGARIADAFSMMEEVLGKATADKILTSGLNGEVMLLAKGYSLGNPSESLLESKGLMPFVQKARDLIDRYPDSIMCPTDFAVDDDGRREVSLDDLPADRLLIDIGASTISRYIGIIQKAATIFVNGPAGMYEQPAAALGTQRLWSAIAAAPGYSVIGGGDSVAAATRFRTLEGMGHVCTAGGGMVRFLSGQELPVVRALRRAALRHRGSLRE